jgi:hypothetical protein
MTIKQKIKLFKKVQYYNILLKLNMDKEITFSIMAVSAVRTLK